MTAFQIDDDLEIGSVFEVAGGGLKIALRRDIKELTRTHSGRVYSVGQVGSIVKLHLGRRIIFATVRLLRLQSDEETAAIAASIDNTPISQERRVIEADLLGEAWWNSADGSLNFERGVTTYPLPLQPVHLITKEETEKLFESAEQTHDNGIHKHVSIGDYVGATRASCHADVDKLFGQHCAILGSTGSGKSSAVAAIIRSVLEHQFQNEQPTKPHIIIIDPHGEYAAAFPGQCTVYRAYDALAQGNDDASNLALPYWLMSGDEFRSLLIGKTEFEATSQSNIVYKALAHSRMVQAGLAKSALDEIPTDLPEGAHPEEPLPTEGTNPDQIAAFDRDEPRPFKLKEFKTHIINRQAIRPTNNGWDRVTKSEFQRDYASILNKFRVLTTDPRINFLMAEYGNDSPSLSAVLSQFVDISDGQESFLKIVDISGLPNEVAGPLTAAIARTMFQYKLHQKRVERERDPILLVCEEAHRYVPNRGEAQYAVAQDAIRRIAREGRKYGLGLMLVSQRPADVEGTVISQCNSWIVLRLSNSRDQEHVSRFLPDSLTGMAKLLSSLPRQEALFVGEAAAIPARIKLRTLSDDQLPDSGDISFGTGWSSDPLTADEISAIAGRMTT